MQSAVSLTDGQFCGSFFVFALVIAHIRSNHSTAADLDFGSHCGGAFPDVSNLKLQLRIGLLVPTLVPSFKILALLEDAAHLQCVV